MDGFLQDPANEKLLTEHNEVLAIAESLEGMNFELKSTRDELVKQFGFRQKMNKTSIHGRVSPSAVDVSFAPPIYPPSLAPLKDLNKVMIKDLVLETHHRGSFILVRTITQAEKLAAVMVIVEDEKGNAILLRMLNEKLRCQDGSLDEGQVLLIKEPYLTLMSNEEYGIRVDHVSDIVFIPITDQMVPSVWREEQPDVETWVAADWISVGNLHFKQDRFYSAIECYSKALESSPTKEEIHYLQFYRGKSFFLVDEWEAALRDLETLPEGPKSDKALRGQAQALYHLNRFRESCNLFTKLCKKCPDDTSARDDFRKAIARLAEQEKGRYNFGHMQEEESKTYPPLLNHATWIGPIEVRQTESQGRGIFTTQPVKVGDLLLCEKAFAYAIEDPTKPKWCNTLLINTDTRAITRGGQIDLTSSIIEKLYKNPSLTTTITNLHSDGFKAIPTAPVDDKPVVDTFQIARIVTLNSFGSPSSSRGAHIPSANDSTNNPGTLLTGGVWPYASMLNHSCISNANRAFIGDMMIIRATTDIPANTELKIWYLHPSPENQPSDFGHWGFECKCAICEDVRGTEARILKKRVRVRAQIAEALDGVSVLGHVRAEIFITILAGTYSRPVGEIVRVGLWEPMMLLAAVFDQLGEVGQAGEVAFKALEAAGFVIEGVEFESGGGCDGEGLLVVKEWGFVMDGIVHAWLFLRKALRGIAPEKAAQAGRYARMAYLICVGEDESFEAVYGRGPDEIED